MIFRFNLTLVQAQSSALYAGLSPQKVKALLFLTAILIILPMLKSS
jgi:hypothetical protein